MSHPLDGKIVAGENILWEGKMNKKVFIYLVLRLAIFFVLLFFYIKYQFGTGNMTCGSSSDGIKYVGEDCNNNLIYFAITFSVIFLIMFFQYLFRYLSSYMAITDKQIFKRASFSFFKGPPDFIYLNELITLSFKINPIDKLLGVGTITFRINDQVNNQRVIRIKYIDNVENVYNILAKAREKER